MDIIKVEELQAPEGMGLCMLLKQDLPVKVTTGLIGRYYLYEVELDDEKYSAVLMNYMKEPEDGIGRTSRDLLATGQTGSIPDEFMDEFMVSPTQGLLLNADLTENDINFCLDAFHVDRIEINGQSRHVVRTAWVEVHPLTPNAWEAG